MNRNTNSNILVRCLHPFVIAFPLIVAFGIMPGLTTQAATLQWNTFMGSSRGHCYAIAVGGTGNVYVAGQSDSTWGTPVNAHAGHREAFVAKLDSNGSLQWNTFMGPSSEDYGYAIAVDGSRNAYVAGYSQATWGTPVNAHAGGDYTFDADAFAAKLDSSGSLLWNTFMGSSSDDRGRAIAVDGSGNVYVAGYSRATWETPVNAHAGGDYTFDAFAAKLDSSGSLQWNTFMGSTDNDHANAIAVDWNGNIYVVGGSDATWGNPVNAHAGDHEAFAAKLDSSGSLQWNTFMGSSSGDVGYAIAVDGSENVYVAGYSQATWGTPGNAHTGSGNAFAAKLDSSGSLQWNTFMGSSSGDVGYAIAVNWNGNVYITGYSYATWGNPVNAYTGSGYADAFAANLDSSGFLQWNTFMGSWYYDEGSAIAVDWNGNVYVAGYSQATWGTPVNAHGGGGDAFVAKIIPGSDSASSGCFIATAAR